MLAAPSLIDLLDRVGVTLRCRRLAVTPHYPRVVFGRRAMVVTYVVLRRLRARARTSLPQPGRREVLVTRAAVRLRVPCGIGEAGAYGAVLIGVHRDGLRPWPFPPELTL